MRSLALVCGMLLAACSTTAPARVPNAPQARFHYADLNLRDPADGQTLVTRVDEAAAEYCRLYSAIVTPAHRRAEPRYCSATMRIQLMWAMPREVRIAYDEAWTRRTLR